MNVGVRVGVGDGVGVEVGVEVVVGVFVSVGLRGGSGVDVSTGIGQGGVGELSAEDGAEQRPTKNAVAANMPIEIIQNEIPTKSSKANKTVSAFAVFDIPTRAIRTMVKILSLFIIKGFFDRF